MVESLPRPPRRPIRLRLRDAFFAGVLFTAPAAITGFLVWRVLDAIDVSMVGLIPAPLNPGRFLPIWIPGIGLALLAVLLVLVGMIAAGFVGRLLMRAGETVLARTPVVRSIYGAAKQVFEAMLGEWLDEFSAAVLIEWPRDGIWTVAFVTGRPGGKVDAAAGEELFNVFLPTTPNPTGGLMLVLPI
jgi:uncharacterized membrane protein